MFKLHTLYACRSIRVWKVLLVHQTLYYYVTPYRKSEADGDHVTSDPVYDDPADPEPEYFTLERNNNEEETNPNVETKTETATVVLHDNELYVTDNRTDH